MQQALASDYPEKNATSVKLTGDLLCRAVGRNLGGKPEELPKYLEIFLSTCLPEVIPGRQESGMISAPSVQTLIHDNLSSSNCRHLMLLTTNDSALHLLFGCGIVAEKDVQLLVGSKFKEDRSELHLTQQINQVSLFTVAVLIFPSSIPSF